MTETDSKDQEVEFWRFMNGQRELWDSLDCHVIFFLRPHGYGQMLSLADHLADFISLKLHIDQESKPEQFAQESISQNRVFSNARLSPKVAEDRLKSLRIQLVEALTKDLPPSVLIRRFYLPMFEAALNIPNFSDAKALRDKISENDVPEKELYRWLELNFYLDLYLRNLTAAEKWAHKLLRHGENLNIQKIEAVASHQLGNIAEEQRDFEKAEKWYRKSLEITEKQGNEHVAASTYHQLGRVAEEQRDFEKAEKWYRKSLEIFEKQGDEHSTAITYHQLGSIAEEQRDFEKAEKWYRKSLEITEKQGNEHVAVSTYHQLGILVGLQKQFLESGKYIIKSMVLFGKNNDSYSFKKAVMGFMKTYEDSPSEIQQQLDILLKKEKIELKLPETKDLID